MEFNPNAKPRNRGRIKIFIIIFLILVIVPAATAAWAYGWYTDSIYTPASDDPTPVAITVAEGDTLLSLSSELEVQGILTSADALKIYLRLESPSVDFLAGDYLVPRNLSIPELIDHFGLGPVLNSTTVAIPEGLRYDEIAEIILNNLSSMESSLFDKQEYLSIAASPDQTQFDEDVQGFLNSYKPQGKSLEGFLFPDTYVIADDAAAVDIIELQIRTLISRLAQNDLNPDTITRVTNFYEVLILATITEREANNLEDMKIVSDIFMRRMEIGEIVGADAPLLYPLKDWSHELTLAEIADTSNPYNTRKLLGLPPTPIANPGINAIMSVMQPTPNSYVFFVSAGGVNYYAEQYWQHCENIRIHLGGSC